jgi:hypothetical protein
LLSRISSAFVVLFSMSSASGRLSGRISTAAAATPTTATPAKPSATTLISERSGRGASSAISPAMFG